MTDEERLQRDIEEGKAADSNNLDARAYQSVFRALQTPPGYQLSSTFADRVVQKFLESRNERDNWKDFFWFGAGICLLVIAFIASVVISVTYLGFNPDLGFLFAIAEYKGLIIIAVILIGIFNRIDKHLVRSKYYH